MFFFGNLKLNSKFIFCFSIIIFLMLCLGIFSIYKINILGGFIHDTEDITFPNVNATRMLETYVESRKAEVFAYIADNKKADAHAEKFAEITNKIKANADLLNSHYANDKEISSYVQEIIKYTDLNTTRFEQLRDMIHKGDLEEVYKLLETKVAMNSKKLVENADKIIHKISHNHEISTNMDIVQIIVLMLFALVLSLVLSWVLTKQIASPIKKLSVAVDEVANGNISTEIHINTKDEIGKLSQAFTHMVSVLRNIVTSMEDHAKDIKESSRSVREGNETISVNMADILAQTLTVSAASEEMAATSKDIANNCSAAAAASAETQNTSLSSMKTVHEAVDGIRRHQTKTIEDAKIIDKLGEQTSHIGSIIATIQDIASQTNLLALNAAIEAARAGEHGRGFAVVSDEVRALANRTAESAQEISQMIKSIQDEVNLAKVSFSATVEQMAEVASRTAGIEDALNMIISQVNGVNDQINQIANATEQQTTTSDDMSRNLQQISDMSKVIADSSQSTVSAAEHMEGLSETISSDVEYFHQ